MGGKDDGMGSGEGGLGRFVGLFVEYAGDVSRSLVLTFTCEYAGVGYSMISAVIEYWLPHQCE